MEMYLHTVLVVVTEAATYFYDTAAGNVLLLTYDNDGKDDTDWRLYPTCVACIDGEVRVAHGRTLQIFSVMRSSSGRLRKDNSSGILTAITSFGVSSATSKYVVELRRVVSLDYLVLGMALMNGNLLALLTYADGVSFESMDKSARVALRLLDGDE